MALYKIPVLIIYEEEYFVEANSPEEALRKFSGDDDDEESYFEESCGVRLLSVRDAEALKQHATSMQIEFDDNWYKPVKVK